MNLNESTLIAKGFTEPTDRVKALKKEIVEAMPVVETERAVLVTDMYKDTPKTIRKTPTTA